VNAIRMWWFSTGGNDRVATSFGAYLKNIYLVPLHVLTQKRYAQCGSKRPWLVHLGLMASYVTMLVLIMFFLRTMQDGPAIQWTVHAFGYAASFGLVATAVYFLRRRTKRDEPAYLSSHESDWMFLWLLFLVTVTGVVQHVLHRSGLGLAANVAYVVHLMLVVPMLLLEVPFSKWSHMMYRPLAVYLAATQRDALHREEPDVPIRRAA
jgi:quinone-modifying oxidoreductase subunit QmoC